jgi:predicted TIM-barrel fold metal-dependent hydrolase
LRLDSHHSFTEQYSLAHLETILKRNRFEGSLLIGPLADTPDFVRGIVVPVTEWRDDLTLHPKFRGILVTQAHGLRAKDLKNLEDRRIPVDISGDLAAIPDLAARHPHLPIAIDHLGAPATADWPRLLEAAAQFPLVCCKLSGLAMFPEPRPYVQHALRLFGPHRLMFGSDWPRGLPGHTWKANLALFTQSIGAQSIETREQLLGGTAARFYGI